MFYWQRMLRLGIRAPRLATALNFPERRHEARLLQHRPVRRRPSPSPVIVADKHLAREDGAIADRLLAAYHAGVRTAAKAASSSHVDLWTLIREEQGELESLLDRNRPAELAAYLNSICRRDGAIGIGQGEAQSERIARDAAFRRRLALSTHDKLISLAEAVGALDAENPEAWFGRANLRIDPAVLVERIGQRIGVDITPPDVDGGMLKLEVAGGRFCDRDLWAIFTAHLLRGVLKDRPEPRICEIGGGWGRAAYWSHRLGLTSYTIGDLPLTSLIQGYYLMKTLGAERVVLYGEPDEGQAGRVRLLPNHAIAALDGNRFDLVLNQDSFAEMHGDIVDEYLAWIRKTCGGGLLMSVNHECKAAYGHRRQGLAHVSVPEAVERMGGYERLQRFPYWLRKGYVTELYRVLA